jgi:methylmalonyl-CoA mutase N-terminal domain/subunit
MSGTARGDERRTASGLVREPVYAPQRPQGAEAPPAPGRFPFTRGLHPTGYRGRPWAMRQYAGFGTAAESNRRYRYLLEQGTSGLSVAFDLPTQIGYDSDDPRALGEVGRVGVAICSLEDMEQLFDGIPLERVSTSMTINATAAILLALYLAVARRRGIPEDALSGTLQNDILKEYSARGTWIYPPAPSMRLVTDVIGYCVERVPKWNPISVSGYHMREAGATAPQELAFTFANALAYVRAARAAGLDPERACERLSFFFACHSDFVEEVAKFRCARRLWARLARERLGMENPRAQACRFHVQTGGVTLTAQQPDNNVVRVALQTLAAVLGGCQSLHTNARDEALGLPTEASARLALRTQQIVAHESGVADTVDPLGGSYAIEAATDALEAEALRLIERVEAAGGAIAAIERGLVQAEIQEAAYRHQQQVESGERVIVGVNRFRDGAEPAPGEILHIDPELERAQVERLRALRARRPQRPWVQAMDVLEAAARSGANLLPPMVDAVLAWATVGEIAGRLREIFGEHRETLVL